MRGPKEDPAAKRARQQERRLAAFERKDAASRNARGLTTDLFSVYGAQPGVKAQAAPRAAARPTQRNSDNPLMLLLGGI